MKTFKEHITESGVVRSTLRKGSVAGLARQASISGNKAEAAFKQAAQSAASLRLAETDAERWKAVAEALGHISKGHLETRQQLGAITSMLFTSQIL